MFDWIVAGLPWVLSAITIWMTVLAGNKHKAAWLIGLLNQALWLVWIVASASWGLLPMNLALWIVYARNHVRWAKDAPIERRERAALAQQIDALLAIPEASLSHRIPYLARQLLSDARRFLAA